MQLSHGHGRSRKMAAARVSGVDSPHLLRSLCPRHRLLSLRNHSTRPLFFFSSQIRASAAAAASSAAVSFGTEQGAVVPGEKSPSGMNILACPICYNPLITRATELPGSPGVGFECSTCRKAYTGNEAYIDLTVSGGSKDYTEAMPPTTELFRSPLVSFLYERGWRQNFIFGGFPGPEKEFEMAKAYLKPTVGGTVVDASCGSGMFSRLFTSSKLYSTVIALDFSENMLRQCNDFVNQEGIPRDTIQVRRVNTYSSQKVNWKISAERAV